MATRRSNDDDWGPRPSATTTNNNTDSRISNNLPHQQSLYERRRVGKKATKHRKRHIPVGPAGIWFQTQLQQQQQPRRSGKAGSSSNNDATGRRKKESGEDAISLLKEEDEQTEYDIVMATTERSTGSGPRPTTEKATFYSPAWTAAQCSLKLSTPSCPAFWNIEQRYKAIRTHISSEYNLIPEILAGKVDWKIQKKLLVQIETIQSVGPDLWTISLQDETSETITAWIDPIFVQKNQQTNQIRVGYVWLLQNCTIQLIDNKDSNSMLNNNNNNNDSSQERNRRNISRMLLISEKDIKQVWMPSDADEISNIDYIQWMEIRNSLTASLIQQEQQQTTITTTQQQQQSNDDNASVINHDDQDLESVLPSEEDVDYSLSSNNRVQGMSDNQVKTATNEPVEQQSRTLTQSVNNQNQQQPPPNISLDAFKQANPNIQFITNNTQPERLCKNVLSPNIPQGSTLPGFTVPQQQQQQRSQVAMMRILPNSQHQIYSTNPLSRQQHLPNKHVPKDNTSHSNMMDSSTFKQPQRTPNTPSTQNLHRRTSHSSTQSSVKKGNFQQFAASTKTIITSPIHIKGRNITMSLEGSCSNNNNNAQKPIQSINKTASKSISRSSNKATTSTMSPSSSIIVPTVEPSVPLEQPDSKNLPPNPRMTTDPSTSLLTEAGCDTIGAATPDRSRPLECSKHSHASKKKRPRKEMKHIKSSSTIFDTKNATVILDTLMDDDVFDDDDEIAIMQQPIKKSFIIINNKNKSKENNPPPPPKSEQIIPLFQNSNFAGMDLDDLLDDE